MTIVQQARTAGFRANLAMRGVSVQLNGAGPEYNALIQPLEFEDNGQFALEPEARDTAIVAILRVDLAGQAIAIGDVLVAEDSAEYRVAKIKNQPVDIAIRFTCEVDP